jgi:acyl-CoA synthetase (AMP-forming)/AMP-acid ligase II/thioesterase domain-containing protein/acyl carrier protein
MEQSFITRTDAAVNGHAQGMRTLHELLAFHAGKTPDAPALAAPGLTPLSYRQLLDSVVANGRRLRRLGLGRHDRVALVLPNGPELASAFLTAAVNCVAAPLNPALRRGEFEAYFKLLQVKAVLAHPDCTAAREAAQALGRRVLDIEPSIAGAAGAIAISGISAEGATDAGLPDPEDVGLVLCTSGTTSQPKRVPLSHRNLCAIARNISTAHALSSADCSLNILPLFHLHGLSGALLAPLAVGASIVCTGGLELQHFGHWLEQFRPTFVTAVPTMWQAILEWTQHHALGAVPGSLRFLRSASSPLPPTVMQRLEAAFHVPVIEIYGLTETGPLTSNCLPPGIRKPASAGKPAGPELAIVGPGQEELPAGSVGEVVVRGDNVTRGYEDDSQANVAAFAHGWFHTGDLGYLDADGYLFLTGRSKELINRAGEKISPREVEETLLQHAAVAEAAVFAVPHPVLGENVAAAVVLRDPGAVKVDELRHFVAGHLPSHKVPASIMSVAELPKGPTGKVQRKLLAEMQIAQAALAKSRGDNAERGEGMDEVEQTLAEIWRELLGLEHVSRHDNFFALGGDSVSAGSLLLRIEEELGLRLVPETLYRCQTIATLAESLFDSTSGGQDSELQLIATHRQSGGTPLFILPPAGAPLVLRELIHSLEPLRPTYVFQSPHMHQHFPSQQHIENLAGNLIASVLKVQPHGPYHLCGSSYGGVLAWELARQLQARGERIAYLGILDTRCPGHYRGPNWWQRLKYWWRFKWPAHHKTLARSSLPSKALYAWRLARRLAGRLLPSIFASKHAGVVGGGQLSAPYEAIRCPLSVHLYRAQVQYHVHHAHEALGWEVVAQDGVQIRPCPGDHYSMLQLPHVQALAKAINMDLSCVQERATASGVAMIMS